jgi:cation transport protein ChaC
VFGYGSLIWHPGFRFRRAERALLRGAHRCLCLYSDHYRGTPERPGLVFGLAQGGSCGGMAFEIDDSIWPEVLAYLRERELLGNVYREVVRPARLTDGRVVHVLTYLAIETHPLFAGRLSLDEQLAIVAGAVGRSGSNRDYVLNTARHLQEIGIYDRQVAALAKLLGAADEQAA